MKFLKLSALFRARRRQRGNTLLEGVLYVGLILAFFVASFVVYRQLTLANNVADTARAVSAISAEVRNLHRTAIDFEANHTNGNMNAFLISAGAVPVNFVQGSSEIRTAFGNAPRIVVAGNGQQFDVTFSGLPENGCTRMATEAGDVGILGVGYAITTANCATGSLVVRYDR